MDDYTLRLIVTAASVISGSVLGYFLSLRQHTRQARRMLAIVVTQSVQATTVLGSIYVDLAILHYGITHDEAMKKLIGLLRAAGIPAESYKIRGDQRNVH